MKNILITEDDMDISNMLCELLTQNGYAPHATKILPKVGGTQPRNRLK